MHCFIPQGDGLLSKQEIRNFYGGLIGVEKDKLDKVTNEGFRAMTAVSLKATFFLEGIMSDHFIAISERNLRIEQGQLLLLLCQLFAWPYHLWTWKVHLWSVR